MPPRKTKGDHPADDRPPSPEQENQSLPDDENDQENPRDSTADRDYDRTAPNLAEAITLMTEELRRRDRPTPNSKRPKAKEPDTFDGSDSRKLNNFILLCNLFFRHNPSYSDDSAKVTFALSYLRGTALEYFEPSLLDSDDIPDWMEDWSAFINTLKIQFGPIDPTADAENNIDHLKMQDNQHIVKYNVEFNRLAIRTGWDDSVLRHRYYSGLAERIKDIMGQQVKPSSLDAMKTLAHSIDSRHWERLREKSRAGKNKPDDKTDDKTGKPDKNNNKSDKNTNQSDEKGNNSGNNNNKNNKSGKPQSSSGNSTTLNEKLGKDGKLTPQERQRRFDQNLCMFCGGTGHTARDCQKASSSAAKAKARAAQAKEKESSDSEKV